MDITLYDTHAVAYVLRGDWVAGCPRADCSNVEFLDNVKHPKSRCTKETFHCTYCKMIASVVWPTNATELMEPLRLRPVPHTRNWFPYGHPDALKFRIEHGQTPEDLWRENREHGVD